MNILRWKLIKIYDLNDYNTLYGAVRAAYTRLKAIPNGASSMKYDVEKWEVLALLKRAKIILK